MSIRAALNLIRRYGYKGAAVLVPAAEQVGADDLTTLDVTTTASRSVDLMSYVGSYPSGKIDGKTIFSSDLKILAAPDHDWSGIINPADAIKIDGKLYEIISFKRVRVKTQIAYVEIQVRG